MRTTILGVAILLVGLSQIAPGATIFVVGTVSITSGNATDTITGTSITFACDTTANGNTAGLTGGCAEGEIASQGNGGALGTPSGPLESTGTNGEPPVGSGVYIANLSTSTTFPLSPALEFMNSTESTIGIDVKYSSVGPGAQTNCTTSSTPGGAACSLYVGDPVTLSETTNGITVATLGVNGSAWDPTMPTDISNFSGAFSVDITSLPNGTVDPTPAQVQAYFGCPTNGSSTAEGSCTALGNTLTLGSTGTFTATFTAPEPGTISLMMIGTGLISLAALLRRRGAKEK